MNRSSKLPYIGCHVRKYAVAILLAGILVSLSCLIFLAIFGMSCDYPSSSISLEENFINVPLSEGASSEKLHLSTNLKKIIIVIISSPNNEQRRRAIRETWLSTEHSNVSTYFVIATEGLEYDILTNLHSEQRDKNDLILLTSTHDDYRDLTTKLVQSFDWIYNHYTFEYLMKVDDDSFVRIDKLLNSLSMKPRDRLYWGFFDGRANVKKQGQWAEDKWVLCDKYLPHARGGGYVLSHDLVGYVVKNADFLQKFNSEDVSIGAWLGPLAIQRIHDPRFDTEYISRGCNNEYIVTHKQSIEDMQIKWSNLIRTGKLCEREVQKRPSYVYNWKVLPSNCCIRNDTGVP